MNTLLDLNPGMLIWTFLTFGILLFVLKRFAWKPLLGSLTSREDRISSDLQRAEQIRIEAERMLSEHKALMDNAEGEARALLADARKTAEKLRDDILKKAEDQAQAMTQAARAEIVREKETAILQLRTEVAELAIQAAGRILHEELDQEKHRSLVDTFISHLPNN